jgi:heme oxygenase
MTRPGPVLTRLRAATAAAHKDLERSSAITARAATSLGRGLLARDYYLLHAQADRALAPWLMSVPGLHYAERRRTPLLKTSLRRLGVPTPPLDAAPSVPALDGCAEALGFLYVIEGSALGGRTILRSLARTGIDLSGLDFLDPYGPHAAKCWGSFVRVIEREVGSAEARVGEACRGATKGFAYAKACLSVYAAAA